MGTTTAGSLRARALIVLIGIAALIALIGPRQASAEVAGVAPANPALEAEPKPVRELPELRSEDSKTDLLSNGAHALTIYDHAVNFSGSNGTWQPIEDQLVQQADGSWQPQASPTPISFPASLGSAPVSIGSGAHALSFNLEGAARSEGAPAGTQHIYRGALPDTDVAYTAAPQAVRETLTLTSAGAPTVFRYKLNLASGLHASLAANGSVLVEDSQGAVVYTLTPPSASDANPARPFPSRSAVHYELSEGGTVLSVVLDKAWLDDPSRIFPVTIDPEVWFSTTKDCSIISAGFANNDECGSHLYVGPDSPNPSEGIARSLLYFNTSSVPKGSTIVASYLRLHFSWDTTSSPITVEAHALMTHSFTSGVTWNRYDGTNAWTTAGGDFEKAVAGERVDNNSEVGENLRFGFTPQVEQWVRDPTSNDGILLKAHDETKAGYDAFAQSGNTESAPEPGLEVIYEPRLGIPPMGQVYQQPIANGGVMSVNVANGNLNVADPDANYSSEGYDTELGRSCNSQDDLLEGASFGDWRLTKGDDPKLFRYSWDGTNTFYSPDGGDTRFDRASWADGHPSAGDKAFTGEAGYNEGLIEHEGGTRTLTFPGGVEWKFGSGASGEATEMVDPGGVGNTISLTYAEERLSKLKDTHEHSLTVSRNGSHDVTKLVGKAGEEWKYEYSSGRLTKYNGPGSVEAKYGYYESGLLKDIVDSSGTWVISYDEQKRVSSIRKVVNGSIGTVGSEDEITSFSYETEQTTVTNPVGGKVTYHYDEFGNIVEEPATQEAASEVYASYAGIEAEAAKQDVDLEDHAALLDSQLSQQLGGNYTGEWFAPGTKPIKIGLTSEGYEQTVEQDLDNLGLSDNAEIVPTTSSWEQLEAAENSLGTTLASLIKRGRVSLSVDVGHNAVTLTQADNLTSGEVNEVETARKSVAVTSEVSTASTNTVAIKLTNCLVGACSKPLRGGVRIRKKDFYNEAVALECTAGFIAQSQYNGTKYVLTAGHCINFSGGLNGESWGAKYHEAGESEEHAKSATYGVKSIGPARAFVNGAEHEGVSTISQGDMGLIEIPSTSFWASPLEPIVIAYGGSGEIPRNEQYPIIGTAYNPQNPRSTFIVCAGGVTATEPPTVGEDCGVITGLLKETAAENPATGETLVDHNLTQMDVCPLFRKSHLGDGTSGAPVYKDGLARGINIGGDGACLDSYEGINTIESVLHVHVLRK